MRWSPADLPPPSADPEDVRRAADDILARDEFREPSPGLLERVLDAIGDALSRTFAALTGSGPGGLVGTVVLGLLVTGAVWLLVRSIGGGGWAAVWAAPTATLATGDRRRTPDEWRAEADRLHAAGDLRGALRCHHRVLVTTLVDDGVVGDVPGRTASEVAAEASAVLRGVDDDLRRLTAEFEAAWYGDRPVDAAGLADFRRAVDRVLAGGRASAPAEVGPAEAGS